MRTPPLITARFWLTDHLDTIYADLARYEDQSVATIKSKFRYWFEAAAWHRPTLLIFDNMHGLLSTEQEVSCRFFSSCVEHL